MVSEPIYRLEDGSVGGLLGASDLVSGLRLGLPSEEDDLFERLANAGVISEELKKRLREMKGFRNLLVHEYGRVDDRIVFEILRSQLEILRERS